MDRGLAAPRLRPQRPGSLATVLGGSGGHPRNFLGDMLTHCRLRKITSWGPGSPFMSKVTFPSQVSSEEGFLLETHGVIFWLTTMVLIVSQLLCHYPLMLPYSVP